MTEDEELELLTLERERAMSTNAMPNQTQPPQQSNMQRMMQIAPKMIPNALMETGKTMRENLPTLGAVAGGLAGGTAGTVFGMGVGGAPGAMGGAALGGAAGEAGRQLLGRMLGEKSPATPGQAASGIAKEGAIGAAGEGIGGLIGKGMGAAYKGLPRIAQGISGTPRQNIAKAQARGFVETYFPSNARGISREVAGARKGAIDNFLQMKYMKPDEMADLAIRDSGFAKEVVKKSLSKRKYLGALSVPEAFKTVKAIDVIYRDTPQGVKVAPELAKLRKYADAIVAQAHPKYKTAKTISESTILRSQLSKPFRVNKSNPDEFSGFTGAIMPAVGGAILGSGGSVVPALGAALSASPLAFGLTASILGSLKKNVPAIVRKTIGRTGGQAGIRTAVEALRGSRE